MIGGPRVQLRRRSENQFRWIDPGQLLFGAPPRLSEGYGRTIHFFIRAKNPSPVKRGAQGCATEGPELSRRVINPFRHPQHLRRLG